MIIKTRNRLINLIPDNGIAIELGVAKGDFSAQIIKAKPNLNKLFLVDRWAGDRNHDEQEFDSVCERFQFNENIHIFKHTFEDTLDWFSDGLFDFIYIDGYAHTGQEEGKTIYDWFPKVKKGGIFAGHDYDKQFPLTIKQVDRFFNDHPELNMHLTSDDRFNSWWAVVK